MFCMIGIRRLHTRDTTISQSSHHNFANVYLEKRRNPMKVKVKALMITTMRIISALRDGESTPLQMRFCDTNVAAIQT